LRISQPLTAESTILLLGVAGCTGLEPVASGVTGRDRLKLRSARARELLIPDRNWRHEGRNASLDRHEVAGLELFRPYLKLRPRE